MLKNVYLNNNKKNPKPKAFISHCYPSALDWKDLGCGSVVPSWSTPKSTFTAAVGVPRLNLGAAAFFLILSARFLGKGTAFRDFSLKELCSKCF